jgi:hypothetical protein
VTGWNAGMAAARLLRDVLAATCGCAGPRWKVDATRTVAGLTVRAEVRSN